MQITAKNANAENIRRGKAIPELLSPAGSFKALEAAIEAGADAVYMGGVAYNARINAKNFTEEELVRGIALAHSYGVKVYIAANTLCYDRELDGFLRAAEFSYLAGADALIIADLGAAQEVHKRIPIELHASTQCSGHSASIADLLGAEGFSRMVCAREMSGDDIEHFIDVSPLEAEVFVHGALCVCHSGQCLFSSLVGGRSGNRGECAQPCRLPYGRDGKYPLSLKDLTLASHIPQLCRMGVSSLKIEGRMKSPEYVRDVTAIWRCLLDARCAATPTDIRELADIFSRGGFTDGYFTKNIDKSMLGVRSEQQKQTTRTLEPFEKLTKKIPLDIHITVQKEAPMSLLLTRADGSCVTVTGDIPMTAINAPIDSETVIRSISKLGATCYSPSNITADIDEGLMVPVSQLNALRRKGIDALSACENTRQSALICQNNIPQRKRKHSRTAMFFEPSSIPQNAYSYFDIIYTPLEKYTGNTNGIALPSVIFDSELEEVKKMLTRAIDMGAEHVLVGNIGHLTLVKDTFLVPHGDFRLNVTNNSSVYFTEMHGFEDVILLPELTLSQARDIGGSTALTVYGKIPLMITEKCVGKEIGNCSECESGKAVLVDRKGARFPVMRTFRHRSIIFNCVPIYMADKNAELDRAKITQRHFIFSNESKAEAEKIIKAYQKGTAAENMTKIKRIK